MNELCNLKGHMWYYHTRIDIQRKDGIYSVPTERTCARCLKKEKLEEFQVNEDKIEVRKDLLIDLIEELYTYKKIAIYEHSTSLKYDLKRQEEWFK